MASRLGWTGAQRNSQTGRGGRGRGRGQLRQLPKKVREQKIRGSLPMNETGCIFYLGFFLFWNLDEHKVFLFWTSTELLTVSLFSPQSVLSCSQIDPVEAVTAI